MEHGTGTRDGCQWVGVTHIGGPRYAFLRAQPGAPCLGGLLTGRATRRPYARVVPFLPVPPPGWRRGARLTWVGGSNLRVLVEGAERAQRRQVIVNAARELAESEGWEAVTTRRLADRTEYSQPVLYSHFEGKDAIVSAVASRGLGSWPRYCTTRTRGSVRLLQSSERWPTPTSRGQDSTAVDTAH